MQYINNKNQQPSNVQMFFLSQALSEVEARQNNIDFYTIKWCTCVSILLLILKKSFLRQMCEKWLNVIKLWAKCKTEVKKK